VTYSTSSFILHILTLGRRLYVAAMGCGWGDRTHGENSAEAYPPLHRFSILTRKFSQSTVTKCIFLNTYLQIVSELIRTRMKSYKIVLKILLIFRLQLMLRPIPQRKLAMLRCPCRHVSHARWGGETSAIRSLWRLILFSNPHAVIYNT